MYNCLNFVICKYGCKLNCVLLVFIKYGNLNFLICSLCNVFILYWVFDGLKYVVIIVNLEIVL